jgi:hypothetical protein
MSTSNAIPTIDAPDGERWYEVTERTTRVTPKGLIAALVCETRYTKDFGGSITTHPDKYAVVVETTGPGEETRRSWRPVSSLEAGLAMISDQFSRIPGEPR